MAVVAIIAVMFGVFTLVDDYVSDRRDFNEIVHSSKRLVTVKTIETVYGFTRREFSEEVSQEHPMEFRMRVFRAMNPEAEYSGLKPGQKVWVPDFGKKSVAK